MFTCNFEKQRAFRRISLRADYVIAGGGMTGVCSAITAARAGVKVILVQDRPVLGGNASSEVRLWVLGATSHMGNNNRWSREGGVLDEILVENTIPQQGGQPRAVRYGADGQSARRAQYHAAAQHGGLQSRKGRRPHDRPSHGHQSAERHGIHARKGVWFADCTATARWATSPVLRSAWAPRRKRNTAKGSPPTSGNTASCWATASSFYMKDTAAR